MGEGHTKAMKEGLIRDGTGLEWGKRWKRRSFKTVRAGSYSVEIERVDLPLWAIPLGNYSLGRPTYFSIFS